MHSADVDFDRIFPDYSCPGKLEPFFIKGDWSVHQIAGPLLERIGPADVSIATFNVSDEALRVFVDSGNIRSLRMLLDIGVRLHKFALLLFAAEITPHIHLDSCHSKLFLVSGDGYDFGICGSANLNTGNRYESGFWFTAGPCFDFFLEQFNQAYENAIAYDTDID